MFMTSTANYNLLLLESPSQVYVDTDYSVNPPKYSTPLDLMQSIKENGPLVCRAKVGPQAYQCDPFRLGQKVEGKDIYGWKPGAAKVHCVASSVLLLGVRINGEKAHVYYTQAKDRTRSEISIIREYQPNPTDKKVYVISFKSFLERCLIDIHPVVPFVEKIYKEDPDTFLDAGQNEAMCKEIGQKIFDHYKEQSRGDSMRAKDAVQRICEAAKVLGTNGVVRKAHIEYVWDGIGDERWKWQR